MSTATGLPALDNTLGALYLGIVLAMALWGIGTVQMYYYFNRYPKDAWQIKLHVVTVWVFDTVHQGLVTHAGYTYLVTEYANLAYLNVLEPTLEIMVLFSGIVCLLVQTLLVYRVYRLSEKNVILVIFLMALVLTEFSTTTAFFAKGIRLKSFSEVTTIAWLSKFTNGLAAGIDVLIAAILIFLLHRARTGFRKSESIINRLIIFTINTGALTSVCAIFAVIFICLYPTEYIYITFFICISRLYTNTLFATLNARTATREGGVVDSHEASTALSLSARGRATDGGNNRSFAIKVQTQTERMRDDGASSNDYPLMPMGDNDLEAYDTKAKLSHAV